MVLKEAHLSSWDCPHFLFTIIVYTFLHGRLEPLKISDGVSGTPNNSSSHFVSKVLNAFISLILQNKVPRAKGN